MIKHCFSSDKSLFKAKRLVFFAETATEDEKKPLTPEQKRQQEHGKELESYLGETADEAQKEVENIAKARKEDIQKLLGNWQERTWGDTFKGRVWDKERQEFALANRQEMDKKVTKLAEEKVKTVVEEINGDGDAFVQLHASLSLSILNAKSEVLSDFGSALQAEIDRQKYQRTNIEAARQAIKNTRSWPGRKWQGLVESTWGTNAFKEIDQKIAQFEEMKKINESLQRETTEAIGKKDEAKKSVENARGHIIHMVTLKDASLAEGIEDALTQSILLKDSKKFYDFFESHKDVLQMTKSETDAIFETYRTFMGDVNGAKDNAYDYYLNKQKERGVINRKNDKIEDRMKRVTESGDRKIRLFIDGEEVEMRCTEVKKNKRRAYVTAVIDGEEHQGVIDYSRKVPFLTVRNQSKTLSSYTFSIPEREGRDVSLTEVEFSAKKVEL